MARRICVVVTARPSYSRVRTALLALREHEDVDLQLVLAASSLLDRYGSVVRYVEEDGFDVAARIFNVLEGGSPLTMTKTTGLGVIETATVFDQLRPDGVVVIADRFEIISAAIAGAYMNLPVVHIQGGEVTGSIDEKVRHAVTKLANLHLVSTENAAERVVRMGELRSTVYVTGCPSIDIAQEVLDRPELDGDLFAQYGGVGVDVDLSGEHLVVLQHPVTTEHAEARAQVTETLHAVVDSGLPTLWFWPNPDAGTDGTSEGIRAFRELNRTYTKNLHFFKNLRPDDFLRVLLRSSTVVGNSSVAIRECSYLGVPAVNVGSRQDGRDRGQNVVDVPHDRDAILTAIRNQVAHGRYEQDRLYGDGRAGKRIADVLSTAELQVEKRLAY